jgi:hypothetical protein
LDQLFIFDSYWDKENKTQAYFTCCPLLCAYITGMTLCYSSNSWKQKNKNVHHLHSCRSGMRLSTEVWQPQIALQYQPLTTDVYEAEHSWNDN